MTKVHRHYAMRTYHKENRYIRDHINKGRNESVQYWGVFISQQYSRRDNRPDRQDSSFSAIWLTIEYPCLVLFLGLFYMQCFLYEKQCHQFFLNGQSVSSWEQKGISASPRMKLILLSLMKNKVNKNRKLTIIRSWILTVKSIAQSRSWLQLTHYTYSRYCV